MKRLILAAILLLVTACSQPPAANLATACDTLATGYLTAASFRSAGKLSPSEIKILTDLEPVALASCSKTHPPLDVAGAANTVVAAVISLNAVLKGK